MFMDNSMTDRNAKEDKHKRQLPKNIRQIGNVQGSVRIYMEDYVYTYLHGSGRSGWAHRGSIFVGTRWQENGQKYLFVSGLVHIPDEYFKDGMPEFSDMMWGGVYQDIKCYYDQVEILGWGMDVAGDCAKLTGNLEQVHRKAFQGQEKFAFLLDSLEKEEAFYIYEKNMLRRRDGYYVYYEKNPQMRDYMMQGREEEAPQPEVDPQRAVVTSYREITSKNSRKGGKVFQTFVYASCLALLVAVTAMGVNMMSSAGKIERLEEAVSFLEAAPADVEEDQAETPVDNPMGTPDGIQDAAESGDQAESPVEEPAAEDTMQQTNPQIQIESDQTQQALIGETKDQQAVDTQDAQAEPATEESTQPEQTDEPEAEQQIEDTADEEETPAFAEQDYYIVSRGESLLGISKKLYGKDYTKQLCERNGLEDENKIYAGQKLLLLDK